MPVDDEDAFRTQIAQALAREPSHTDLQVDLAGRILGQKAPPRKNAR